jgi:sodium-dependent phosphate cotransporter
MEQDPSDSIVSKLDGFHKIRTLVRIIILVAVLYFFLFAIGLLGAGFKSLGKDFAKTLIDSTANPFVGLFIGILVTSIIQSSSTTTSIIVGMVASGVMTVGNAIPMVIGANVGTTVTATLVSFGSIARPKEFQRAFAAATMHDFFNILCIFIFFPLELVLHPLEKLATLLTTVLTGTSGGEFHSPIKAIIKPLINFVKHLFNDVIGMSNVLAGIIMIVVSLVIIFFSLLYLVRLLRSLMESRIENTIDRFIGRSGVIGLAIGAIITAIIQSSSVTTSIVVPLVAAQIVSLESGFPIVLGANVGTTVTALLASLAGNPAGLTIALVHLLFNTLGILVIYPIPAIRRIPLSLARGLAKLAARSRIYAVVFVLTLFFILPFLAIMIDKLLG